MIAIIRISVSGKAGVPRADFQALSLRMSQGHNIGVPPAAAGILVYVQAVMNMLVCGYSPAAGSYAAFLWLQDHNMEVVLETGLNGNLFKVAELVSSRLERELVAQGVRPELVVDINSEDDGQTYVYGTRTSKLNEVTRGALSDVGLLVVAVPMMFIAKKWFPGYAEEAAAATVAVVLSGVARLLTTLLRRAPPFTWSVE